MTLLHWCRSHAAWAVAQGGGLAGWTCRPAGPYCWPHFFLTDICAVQSENQAQHQYIHAKIVNSASRLSFEPAAKHVNIRAAAPCMLYCMGCRALGQGVWLTLVAPSWMKVAR